VQIEKKSWYEGKNRYIWFAEELKEDDKVREYMGHFRITVECPQAQRIA
jgi:hypothetical protein